MKTRHRTKQMGFNLIETLMASVILSGAVLTIGAISSNALVGTRLNGHYEIAASIAEKQLTLIDYVGIDEFVEKGEVAGVVEDFEPEYRWEVSTEYEGIDSVYIVALTVTWMEGRRPYHLTVHTMLNGTSLVTTPLGGES